MNLNEENAEYYKEILSLMPGHVYWKSKEGVFLGCNIEQAKAAGFDDQSDMIGKTDRDMPWSAQADYLQEIDNGVIDSKLPLALEEEFSLPDGTEKVFWTKKIPLFKGENKEEVVGVLGISVDITEKKALEDKLRSTVARLKHSDSVKSEFLANMSHDLRTPMTGIMGAFEELGHLVEELPANTSGLESIVTEMLIQTDSGSESSKALLGLLNEILETINLESGKVKRTPENFSLSKVLKKNLDLLSPTALQKGLTLSVEIEEDVPPNLYGLRRTFNRVLVNLIGNAIKFTKEGGVTVKASMISKGNCNTGDKVHLKISVDDTGIGIPADKFEEIFENFSKLVSSYRGVYEGYGLGLYAVKQYVEKMEGTIEVESTIGKGSRFVLSLPFVVSDCVDLKEVTAPPAERKRMVKLPVSAEQSGEIVARILLAEDSAPAALAIICTLKRYGCLVDHAKTGEECISLAKNNEYDLIFMDIGLPDMLGLDAAKVIRAFSAVPMIALTGHVDKEGICMEAGMQGLLAKPASAEDLEVMLQKYVLSKVDEEVVEQGRDEIIIDWNCTVKMLDGSEAIAQEILKMCSEELSESMVVIDKAYAQHNIVTLLKELHRVRGGVCYLKLPQLERALKDFHLIVREQPQEPKEVEKYYQLLKRASSNFQAALLKGVYTEVGGF